MAWINTYISLKSDSVMAVCTNSRRYTSMFTSQTVSKVGTEVETLRHSVPYSTWLKRYGTKEAVLKKIKSGKKIDRTHWEVVRTEQVVPSEDPKSRYNRIKVAMLMDMSCLMDWQKDQLKYAVTKRECVADGRRYSFSTFWQAPAQGTGNRRMSLKNRTMIDLYLTKVEKSNE